MLIISADKSVEFLMQSKSLAGFDLIDYLPVNPWSHVGYT